MKDRHGLHINILEFESSLKPNEFIDWLSAIEKVFEYREYPDKKCKVVVLKFKNNASLWWEKVKKYRNQASKEKLHSWEKFKKLLKKRFLPKNYKQELYLQL